MTDPRELITKHVALVVTGRGYHTPLPPELQPWYVYTRDGGHCITVAVQRFYRPGADPEEFLVPAPVKAVLAAGWRTEAGYVVCDLNYDPSIGLITLADHDEW